MPGAVNTPKNGNAISPIISSVKNGNANNADGNSTKGDQYNGVPFIDTDIIVIDKETESHHTFDIRINTDIIRTIVTYTAYVVDEWIDGAYKSFSDKLKGGNNLIVGLDIEWVRLRDDHQSSKRNRIAVLQLCLENQCLIFQFLDREIKDIPQSLCDFLNDEKIVFVGAGIDGDARKLLVDYGLSVAKSEELGGLADYTLRRTDCYRSGLKSLMWKVFGEKLRKPSFITLCRWDYEFLKDEQVLYACIDAYSSYVLGVELMPRREIVKKDGPREDFKKPTQETIKSQGPKAPSQGARASNQDQGAKAPNQVQGVKAPSQGQGTRPRYYESRIKKPTLLDFMVRIRSKKLNSQGEGVEPADEDRLK